MISNIADLGMNLQAALEAPRFFSFDQGPTCKVVVENRMPLEMRDGLARMGQRLELTGEYQNLAGMGQAVGLDSATGTKYGASDPRADGAAIPERRISTRKPLAMRRSFSWTCRALLKSQVRVTVAGPETA